MRELVAGDHIKASRIGYDHHGIYDGSGGVIHYAGFSEPFVKGSIELTSLEEFAQGKQVSVVQYTVNDIAYFGNEVVERAMSRIGEDEYSLVFNNCEHFACWCVSGKKKSEQVNKVMRNATEITVSSVVMHYAKPAAQNIAKQVFIKQGLATGAKLKIASSAVGTGSMAGMLTSAAATSVATPTMGFAATAAVGATSVALAPIAVGVATTAAVGALLMSIFDD